MFTSLHSTRCACCALRFPPAFPLRSFALRFPPAFPLRSFALRRTSYSFPRCTPFALLPLVVYLPLWVLIFVVPPRPFPLRSFAVRFPPAFPLRSFAVRFPPAFLISFVLVFTSLHSTRCACCALRPLSLSFSHCTRFSVHSAPLNSLRLF